MLLGRSGETAVIDGLLGAAREGRSGALVVRGEAGIGKSALLAYAAERAEGMRVVKSTGVEAESELAFAGLHLMFKGEIDRIGQLPGGQAEALGAALGVSVARNEGHAASSAQFMVGLAVLTLLADLADGRPLLCLVDDAHWLDHESAEALLFASRRLEAEGVVVLFAARDLHAPKFPAPGIDELRLSALDAEAADRVLTGSQVDMPAYVKQQIMAQAEGNPLALRELAVAQREGQLSVEPYSVVSLPVHSRLVRTFADRIAALPQPTQDVLLVAAIAGSCNSRLVLSAAGKLGATAADLEVAERKDLVRVGVAHCLEFRHPLIQSAVYQYAPLNRRTQAHLALAELFTTEADADRRAWHLAAAATGPDESVALALEESAENARVRGGYSAVATGYERAAWLSPDSAQRTRRLMEAAKAALEAGQLDRADSLAEQPGSSSHDATYLVNRAMVHATSANWRGNPLTAHRIWTETAKKVADEQPNSASYMLFHAVEAAWIAADFDAVHQSAELAERLDLPRAYRVRGIAHVVAGLNNHPDGSVTDAVSALKKLLDSAGPYEQLRPQAVSRVLWWHLLIGDHATAKMIAEDLVVKCREGGAIGVLPRALGLLARAQLYSGEHRDAVATASEALRIASDIGKNLILTGVPISIMANVAAIEGDQERCNELNVQAGAIQKYGLVMLDGMMALLDMSLGRYEAVVQRLRALIDTDHSMDVLPLVPDLVEAAVRTGDPQAARAPFAWFREYALHTGQAWAEAVVLRCEALLADDAEAEELFGRALTAHDTPNGRPFEHARTELLYGEWLRRGRRRVQARVQLRAAMATFERLGAKPWAERARTELRATGDGGQTGDSTGRALDRLTPQELQVVRLAARGMKNRDIAGHLFLSPRTVGYHLYKAYPKLGVSSRGELARLDLAG